MSPQRLAFVSWQFLQWQFALVALQIVHAVGWFFLGGKEAAYARFGLGRGILLYIAALALFIASSQLALLRYRQIARQAASHG